MKVKTSVIKKSTSVFMIAILLTISITLRASAEDIVDDNIETMSYNEVNKTFSDLIFGFVNKDTSVIQSRASMFSSDVYENLKGYCQVNDIGGGCVSDIVIDYTTPNNSSTGDTVVMVNAKIWFDDQSYNKLYLFEFHVNAGGDIYGYNIWVY